MEETESFLAKMFSSVVKQQEKEKTTAEPIASPGTTGGKEIPEEEINTELDDAPDTAMLRQEGKKTPSELSSDPRNAKIIEVIKTIEDPEINIDIWTLELVYDIMHRDDGSIEVLMTFTSPMCPFGPQLMQMVKDKVEEIGVKQVDVKVTFSPAWRPSEDVLEMLGM